MKKTIINKNLKTSIKCSMMSTLMIWMASPYFTLTHSQFSTHIIFVIEIGWNWWW